jgi:hypothetical protein
MEPGEQRKHRAADEHVVQMRHDEVRVVELQVEGHRRDHDAGQAAQHEDEEEAQDEPERRAQDGLAGPERHGPAEELHGGRNGDRHAGRGEQHLAHVRQRGCEHMVHPQPERQERGRDQRHDHRGIAELRAPREHGHDRRHDAEAGHEDHVDLGVPEEPEEVLP